MNAKLQSSLNRRRLLKGMGLGAAAQFLPSLRPSYAADGKIPTRLVILYSMHGTLPWLWTPTAPAGGTLSTTSWEPGPMLAPLKAWKNDITLLSGIDSKALDGEGSMGNCGHSTGQTGSLTANKQTGQKLAAGPSFDQVIVEELKKQNGGKYPTSQPSMHLGIVDKIPNLSLWGQPYMAATAAGVKPLSVNYMPSVAFGKAFPASIPGSAPGMTDSADVAKRKSVLDFAVKEFGQVGNKLGKFERDRLEAHAAKIRDLENRIMMMPAPGTGMAAACTPTGMFPANKGQAGWYSNTLDAMPRLMQAVLACDVSRVVCLQCEEPEPAAYGYTPGAAGTTDLHDLVHKLDVTIKEGNDQARLAIAKKFYIEYANTMARVLKLLSEIKESDGKSMLHHTVVLWAGEIAQPGHSHNNYKWVLGGQGGGYLKSGTYQNWDTDEVRWDSTGTSPSNGDLFTTIANAMGVNITSFGPASKGPIAALKA